MSLLQKIYAVHKGGKSVFSMQNSFEMPKYPEKNLIIAVLECRRQNFSYNLINK